MKIDWIAPLRHLLQTLSFCLAISAIQYAFQPEKPYANLLIYSLCIGMLCWAFIDFGRYLFPSSKHTGWPTGASAVALPLAGIVLGFLLGTRLADQWTGLSTWNSGGAQLRISIGITLLAGVAGSYYFYTRGKSAWLQARMNEVRSQAAEAQLKLLQTQLEPHMLFNTLANLRALIGTDPQRAQAMLDRIIAYLRATLGASRSTEHPLADEFERLHDYLELMAVRMGPRLAYTLDLPDALRDAPVPPLLLQPLVENAIRHGLEPRVGGGRLTVTAAREGEALVLTVQDGGVGFEPAQAAAREGSFGLAQVHERVASAYGGRGQVELQSRPGEGTTVRLRLPAAAATP